MSSRSTTLALLGAGGAFSRRYGTTCAALTFADGARWLIDCGRQAPDQLAQAGLSWYDIDGQIVTHVHGDHVYGLEDFAFTRFYVEERPLAQPVSRGGVRPRFISHQKVREEVWSVLSPSLGYLSGPDNNPRAGTLEHYFDVQSATHESPVTDTQSDMANEHYDVAGVGLVLRPVPHVPGKPSCGVEILLPAIEGDGNAKIWWSGDSIVEPDRLSAMARQSRIVFHDCSFAPGGGAVHADYQALLQIPADLRGKIVLMHHEDDLAQHVGRIANDGFRYALPGDVYDLRSGERVSVRVGENLTSPIALTGS